MLSHNQRLREARNVEDQPTVRNSIFVDPAGMLQHYQFVDDEPMEGMEIEGVAEVGYQVSMDISPDAVVEFYGYYEEDNE
jgi:hypothetical protein